MTSPSTIRYRQAVKAGKCPTCGKQPEQGRKLCRPCLDSSNARRAKRMARVMKAHKLTGVCVVCNDRLACDGMRWCGVCAENNTTAKDALRRSRLKAGLCRCGEQPAEGRKQCQACIDKVTAYRNRAAA